MKLDRIWLRGNQMEREWESAIMWFVLLLIAGAALALAALASLAWAAWRYDLLDQLGIAATGVTAVFLTQSKSPRVQRFACLFGIAGQPFWIWSAWHAGQWGILALTSLYSFAWAKGVWQHWIRR